MEDAQTWFATDISIENPINAPGAGGDMFWKPPLLGSCIGTCTGIGGLGTGGGVRTSLSCAAPVVGVVIAALAVAVCAAES